MHFFYHSRRHESSSVGLRMIEVACERCGHGYYYELARVGSGSASAPYGVGNRRAARIAEEDARKDLGRRLDREAELEPCPRCHWINAELVAGYRAGRFRRWGKFAAGLAGFGTVASLIAAWFLSRGPAADRGAVPYVLWGGPAVFGGAALLLLGLRAWLRGRIRPNRDHPLPPALPAGCPPALIWDEAIGDFRAAAPRHPEDDEEFGGWADFQVGRDAMPALCCACLLPAGPKSSAVHPVAPALAISIPLCTACTRRWRRRSWAGGLAAFVAMAGAGIGGLAAMGLDEVVFWMLAGGLGLVTLYVAAAGARHLAAPFRVKVADAPRGIVRLRFRNEKFRRCLLAGDRPAELPGSDPKPASWSPPP